MKMLETSMLTPAALGPSGYRYVCQVAGLDPRPAGYGLLHCKDDSGKRITFITLDVTYHQMLREAGLAGMVKGLEVPRSKYPLERAGWPDDWPYLNALDGRPDQ